MNYIFAGIIKKQTRTCSAPKVLSNSCVSMRAARKFAVALPDPIDRGIACAARWTRGDNSRKTRRGGGGGIPGVLRIIDWSRCNAGWIPAQRRRRWPRIHPALDGHRSISIPLVPAVCMSGVYCVPRAYSVSSWDQVTAFLISTI